MKKILFCLLAFYTPVSIIIAQNTTNSPTSMFGLGELSTGEGGQYAGLGGAGIALRGNNFLNSANPASLTELTEQRFQIDAGIMGAYQIYSQRGASNRSVTGNLNNLSIQRQEACGPSGRGTCHNPEFRRCQGGCGKQPHRGQGRSARPEERDCPARRQCQERVRKEWNKCLTYQFSTPPAKRWKTSP